MDTIPPVICQEFCERGSVCDLIRGHASLDWSLKMSLILDLLEGLNAIHRSAFRYHGSIRSSKCVINGRFCLKIDDLGHDRATAILYMVPFIPQHDMYTAPELVDGEAPTQLTDMYSGAVVALELIFENSLLVREFIVDAKLTVPPQPIQTSSVRLRVNSVSSSHTVKYTGSPRYGRKSPSITACLTPRHSVSSGRRSGRSSSPSIAHQKGVHNATHSNKDHDEEKSLEAIKSQLALCLRQDAIARLTAAEVIDNLQDVVTVEGGFVNDLLTRLEKHSLQLERTVALRKTKLLAEQARCDGLLNEMLPREVVQMLRLGHAVIPELFERATILFNNIGGFSEFMAHASSFDAVELLQMVFTNFDKLLAGFKVYKLETIVDSYIVASGLPVRNGSEHVREICHFALRLQREFQRIDLHLDHLSLIAGAHTGPIGAGVVGVKRPRYCLFGDTVNTASRIASTSDAGRIQLSNDTAAFAMLYGFQLSERGRLDLKGKGFVKTFWLLDRPKKKSAL